MAKEGILPEGWPLAQIPGVILLFVIGVIGIWFAKPVNEILGNIIGGVGLFHYYLGTLFVGVVIANTLGVPKWAEKGVATYKFWL